MNTFGYYDPTSVQKAVGIAKDKPEAKYLAGGQSLLAAMKLGLAQPTDLVDLRQVAELRAIKVEGGGASITIGAMAKHVEVASSIEIGARLKALAELANQIGDRQVRNRGTLGGSIANNDPAADYPAAVLALEATIVTDRRKIPADQYFKGLFQTALDAGEVITSVSFPVPKKAAYQKFKNPASRFAIVGVFVAQTANGARVAVTGAGSRGVFRVRAMEDALNKSWSADAIKSVAVSPADLQSDLHASAEYRAHLINVLAMRAVSAG